MDDRTLIERAAKAAGCRIEFRDAVDGVAPVLLDKDCSAFLWNPLASDAQVARLEADCGINVAWCEDHVQTSNSKLMPADWLMTQEKFSDHGGDKQKARRYASTRAAAALAAMEK